ncbi:hypothetical protein JZ751_019172, partial [Albula glossodonta]
MKLVRLWSMRGDNVKETSPLLPKETEDTEAALSGSPEGEEVHDGKVWPGEELEPCDVLLKALLMGSTLLFCALGLAALGLGLWGLLEKESFAQERIGLIGADPMLLLVVPGLGLALLCLSGCVGALRENACLLRAFSVTLLALVTLQVLAAIATYTLHGEMEGYLRSAMLVAMARYQDDLDLRFLTDELQVGLQCCGADSYQDWEANMYFNCSGPGVQACGVPPSCCVDPLENGTVWNSQCGAGARRLDEFSAQAVVFLGGCLGGVWRWVERNTGVLAAAGVGLLGVQVLGVFLSTRLLDHTNTAIYPAPSHDPALCSWIHPSSRTTTLEPPARTQKPNPLYRACTPLPLYSAGLLSMAVAGPEATPITATAITRAASRGSVCVCGCEPVEGLGVQRGQAHRGLGVWRGRTHRGLGVQRGQAHRGLGVWRGQAHRGLGVWRGQAHRGLGVRRGQAHSGLGGNVAPSSSQQWSHISALTLQDPGFIFDFKDEYVVSGFQRDPENRIEMDSVEGEGVKCTEE